MILVAIDKQWQAHLYNMDALREGISFRAQGQKDPLVEYKNEAYKLFEVLMDSIDREALQNLFRSASKIEEYLKQLHSQQMHMQSAGQGLGEANMASTGSSGNLNPARAGAGGGSNFKLNIPKRKPSFNVENVGRNAPCPCGSGKKFKQCCGREA